ncbi:MAG: MBOAT family protein [Granulosicoccus sp.]
MLFNSWPFVILVLLTALIYYNAGRTESRQIQILIVASLVFYGYGQLALLSLLVTSIVINAICSFEIDRLTSPVARKTWAVAGVLANLLILAAFKYGDLLANSFATDPQAAGGISAWLLQLPLPIGISFYTFQGISLLADTFSGDFKKQNATQSRGRHFRNTFFFISFFPQLVAGPVLKAKQFIPQICHKRWADVNYDAVFHCLVTGYFLKIVVADNLKDQTFWIQFPYFQHISGIELLTLLVAFSAQIFADFAGYSLIAIGVAALLGYELPRNFKFPYISRSISEFWRRWHISLSSWLREYLYFPLGGNRKGSKRTYINLIIVMFLGGLWHGAAWSFAIWGLWHGFGLALERAAVAYRESRLENKASFAEPSDEPKSGAVRSVLQGLSVFLFVTFGWLLFELTDISEAILFLNSMANNMTESPSLARLLICTILVLPVVIYHSLYLLDRHNSCRVRAAEPWLYAFMLFLLIVNAGSSEAFVYFQF